MLTFEFEAKSRIDGRSDRLGITIGPPTRLEMFPHDFECPLIFTGVIEKQVRSVGVTPFQAMDLGMQMAKAITTSYGSDWELYHEGVGPVSLDY